MRVQPSDWLLLLFDGADQPLDRVRIQKAMFLFAQRSRAGESEKYHFVPYNYGPFSFEIYPDLGTLVRSGLLEVTPSASYRLTLAGQRVAMDLRTRVPETRTAFLTKMRSWVMERSFTKLLNDIYDRYPDFAVNSVFRRPSQ